MNCKVCGKYYETEMGLGSHLRAHARNKDITKDKAQSIRHNTVNADCKTGSMGRDSESREKEKSMQYGNRGFMK